MKKPYLKLIQKKKKWYSILYATIAILSLISLIYSFIYFDLNKIILNIILFVWNLLEFKQSNFYEFKIAPPETEDIGIYLIKDKKYACYTEEEAYIHADLENAVPVFLENVKKFK